MKHGISPTTDEREFRNRGVLLWDSSKGTAVKRVDSKGRVYYIARPPMTPRKRSV